MKRRFILYRRKLGGTFYVEDTQTRKQESLGTKNRAEAVSLLNARNESVRQPHLNLQIAKAYLAGTDSGVATRTWQNALDAIVETKSGSTQDRWRRAAKETALDSIRNRVILETQAEHLLACLKAGTVSTNVHLRKLHNFCISMNWLPWPLIPKRLWPEVRFKDKRAITSEEHQLIIEREQNPERRSFYELCWHLGGSQTDIANLKADDIDWPNQTIAYARQKTGSLAMIHFGPDIDVILRRLNATDALFPNLKSVRSGDRATEFKQRCEGLGIKGVTLHSYRYAWAGTGQDVRLPGAVCTRSTRTQQQGCASFLFAESQSEAAVTGKLRATGGRGPNHPVAPAFFGARSGGPLGAEDRLNRVLSFASTPCAWKPGIDLNQSVNRARPAHVFGMSGYGSYLRSGFIRELSTSRDLNAIEAATKHKTFTQLKNGIMAVLSRLRRAIAGGERRLLERLRQLPAEIGDELAQGGDGTGCRFVRRRALAHEPAQAGFEGPLSSRREDPPARNEFSPAARVHIKPFDGNIEFRSDSILLPG